MSTFHFVVITLLSTGAFASRLPVDCEGSLNWDAKKKLSLYLGSQGHQNNSKLFYEIKITPSVDPEKSDTYSLATKRDRSLVSSYSDLAGPLMVLTLGGYRSVGRWKLSPAPAPIHLNPGYAAFVLALTFVDPVYGTLADPPFENYRLVCQLISPASSP